MGDIFSLISDVGLPIAGALVSGCFIFIVIKQILGGVVDSINTLNIFTKSLESRARAMNNEIIKIDLTPPIDRVARAENFVEDGKIDIRRD